jgi:hypothetical protein
MSVRVLCPGCRKKLAIPDHLAGKTLRCPGCQTAFRCPPAGGGTRAPAPAAAGNPFDFTTGSAGAAPGAATPFDFTGPTAVQEAEARPPAAGQFRGLGWRLVRSGVGLAYLGLRFALVAALILLSAGGVAALGLRLQISQPEARAGIVACWIGAAALAGVALLVLGVGGIVSFVGQLLCCAVPQGVASRLCIWFSVALPLAGFLIGGVTAALTPRPEAPQPAATVPEGGVREEAPPTEAPGGGPEGVQKALQSVVPILTAYSAGLAAMNGTWLISELLWLCFLRQVAWLLGNQRLARGVVVYVVWLFAWPLLLSCASGILGLVVWAASAATPTTLPWLVGVPSGLVGLLVLVNWIWYFLLVRRTALTLQQVVQTA